MNKATRLAWIDNLRTFIIILVVSMHACVTYSYVGGWYTNHPPGPSNFELTIFILWQAHLQSFFMGLLFFLAGTFAHRGMQKRGSMNFLKERMVRLGIPSLIYMLCIEPLLTYSQLNPGENDVSQPYNAYWFEYITSGKFFAGSGPTWFAVALLFFCCGYVFWVKIVRKQSSEKPNENNEINPAPKPSSLIFFGLCLVVCSFVVRLFYPLGSGISNMQLGFFSQYISAFVLGIMSDQNGWFEALVKSKSARTAGWIGLIFGPVFLICLVSAGGPPPQEGTIIYSGGWNPWAFGLAFWEQLTGLAIGLGIMSWFYRFGNATQPLADWLSRRSFGVYMLHSPIMVVLTPACASIADQSRLVAALILTVASLIASYVVTDLIIRVPGFRKII